MLKLEYRKKKTVNVWKFKVVHMLSYDDEILGNKCWGRFYHDETEFDQKLSPMSSPNTMK